MLVNFMCTYLLPHCFHKFQPVRLNDGFVEGKGIIPCLYVGSQGVIEVGEILLKEIGSFFIVEKLGWKTRYLWKNGFGYRHGYRCEESNDAKYLSYDISLFIF